MTDQDLLATRIATQNELIRKQAAKKKEPESGPAEIGCRGALIDGTVLDRSRPSNDLAGISWGKMTSW